MTLGRMTLTAMVKKFLQRDKPYAGSMIAVLVIDVIVGTEMPALALGPGSSRNDREFPRQSRDERPPAVLAGRQRLIWQA